MTLPMGIVPERIEALAYEVPTEGAESDGTLDWTSTAGLVVRVHAASR